MIKGMHGLFFTSEPEALRAFLKDKLQLPSKDTGGGWLIFDLPQCDLGVHPTDGGPPSGTHDLSFFTDDLDGTVAGMTERGVAFLTDVEEQEWGRHIRFEMPGGVKVMLYQPKY